ncbi:MAG: hypothetical protein ACFFFG_06080 [Candidatus Thorarchaeota archaeon]
MTSHQDTDSFEALATIETHILVKKYFENTIKLRNQEEYGVIEAAGVLGRKKWGIYNKKGEIHCKVHGKGAYKGSDEAYKELYRNYLTTDYSHQENARLAIKKHPVFQSVSYRKSDSSFFKGIIPFLKKGELINQFQFNEIPLYIYKLQNGKDYDYLIINTTKINKAQFGSYLKLDQFSSNKVIFCILAPCQFMNIVKFILSKPEEETGIIRKTKYHYTKKIRHIYDDLTIILDPLTPEYKVDDYGEVNTFIQEPFDHLRNVKNFEEFFKKDKRKLANALKETFERLLGGSLRGDLENLTPKTWNNLSESASELNLDKDEFLEVFARYARLNKLVDYHYDQLNLEDIEKADLYSQASEKKKLHKKFVKLLEFDKSRFHRNRKILPNKTYNIMIPRPYKRRIKHDTLKEYKNRDKFTSDGFSFIYSGNLPDMDFSADLLSQQNKYYSQAITNIALTASIIWAKTHYTNLTTINEKINNYLTAKKEDQITLPCPKTNKYVLVPFKIQRKIPLDTTQIDHETFVQLFDLTLRHKLIKNKILIKQDNKYIVNDTSKFKSYLKRNYKYEWIEIDWLKRKWSVSIEKGASLDYNATLANKITVDETQLGKRTFECGLRLNPSSKNLHNIDLFKTSVDELDENSAIGKILLEKLFESNLLTYFAKKRATHKEDLQSASKPYDGYKITYLTLAHSNIQRKIPQLRPKLSIVAYTLDLNTLSSTTKLVPHLNGLFRARLNDIYNQIEDMGERIQKMLSVNVSTNRFSLGFNINYYEDKFTISIYGKDFYQHLSKIKRVSNHEKLEDLPLQKIRHLEELKELENDRHKLRIELTIRGWEQIHTKAYYQYLDQIKHLILRQDLALYNENINLHCPIKKCQKQPFKIFYLENHIELMCPKCHTTHKYDYNEIKNNTQHSELKKLTELEIQANKELDSIERKIENATGKPNGLSRNNGEIKEDEQSKQTKLTDFG